MKSCEILHGGNIHACDGNETGKGVHMRANVTGTERICKHQRDAE